MSTTSPPPEAASNLTDPSGGRRALRVAMVLLLGAAFAASTVVARASRPIGEWGTRDFIEYWGANHVAGSGGNPYDPAQLLAVEQAEGRVDDIPLMMWNPPWLLVVMRPVLQRPFARAASVWIGANIVMMALACLLISSGYRRTQLDAIDLVPAALGTLLSLPAVMTINFGQVSLLLLLTTAVLYWSLRQHRDFIAGASLSLLTIKPHLFLLIGVLAGVVILRERRWRIVVGSVVTMATLLVLTTLQSPRLVSHWWQSFVSPPAGAPAAYTWKTPNVPNVIREWIAQSTGHGPSWPLTVIPVVALALCAYWLWRRSRAHSVDELFPLVLCLSVIFAPFGWTFDHVVLTVVQVIVFLRAFGGVAHARHRWALVGAVVACQGALVVQVAVTGTDYYGYWWFPIGMLGVWLMSESFANGNRRHQAVS